MLCTASCYIAQCSKGELLSEQVALLPVGQEVNEAVWGRSPGLYPTPQPIIDTLNWRTHPSSSCSSLDSSLFWILLFVSDRLPPLTQHGMRSSLVQKKKNWI